MSRFRLSMLITLFATLANAQASAAADSPQFGRHVEAVFSRLGCNGGTCHGAVRGQGGFRLSLFAADPALDYERLRREDGGRRLNLLDPDKSLLLLKATAQVPHQGGRRTAVGSADYAILRRWLAAGAPSDRERAALVRLHVSPATPIAKPGETLQLRVAAEFRDEREDVTALCSYQSLDAGVATVTADGRVTATGPGHAAILVRYGAEPAVVTLSVPRTSSQPFPTVDAHNFIDRHILARLRQLNIPPVALADDATFLRRVTLDVAGELPTPAEVRAFLTDRSPLKREKKIEELLARPGHSALWTLRFCDLLKASDFGVYADGIRPELDAPRFQAWVRARLDENLPYDQFVERILTATSREGRSMEAWAQETVDLEEGYGPGRKDVTVYRARKTLDLYWQRSSSAGVDSALQVAHAFLGLRLECAQCHRHPHDVWQQDDLLSFANYFMRVRKIGFQGDNEKKYPEEAAHFKRLNAEGKTVADEAKKLRSGSEFKNLEAEAKRTKADPARTQFEELQKRVVAMERRGRALPEAARRFLHAEVRLLPAGKTFASVSSPIGTASSRNHRLLGRAIPTPAADNTDPRQVVMDWMREPNNPFFARAIVNRVWAHYFGRGIVDPPDNLSPFNPPSHPELLDDLCRGFVEHGYDLRWLHRTILQSRTYQQSSTATADNQFDRANYAFFAYRRLPAEVLVDALNQATGVPERHGIEYYHWPEYVRTTEVPHAPRNPFVAFMLENFGKPKRNAAVQCDCERDGNASVLQVLSLANHPRMREKLADEKGLATRVAREFADNERRTEELFLVALGRFPTPMERTACVRYMEKAESPSKGTQGVLWSLLNTREFILQH